MTEYLYRFEDEMRCGVSVSEWGSEHYYTTGPHLVLRKYRIVKRTPKGAWISQGFEEKRFVLLTARRKFACDSEEDALRSFQARKRKQIKILNAQLRRAEKALRLAEHKAHKAEGRKGLWLTATL